MDAAAAQTQALDRIRQASNILVTVSANPSVDQLAAAIGVTLLLNRLDKHATAVFSGRVPSTIEFLQPEKTLETNTDSLRDFIISLDKNKADKLRYKVEDQFVRIFITPYKTSLSQKDLVFSEGDFNVEVVLALGVRSRSQLDAAITAHGRILHDATTVSVVAGQGKAPDIGQINWQDDQASSLCEMIVGLSDELGQNLIDNQMATAFLTGIVAETARFSNSKTTPKVMSASAKLMAAGANQQLIISKLEPPSASPGSPSSPRQPKSPPTPPDTSTGVLSVSHQPETTDTPEVEVNSSEIRIDEQGNVIAPSSGEPKPSAARIEPEETPPPTMAKQVVDETPIPGPHDLLDPTDHKPAISSPLSADTEPGWTAHEEVEANDPLSENNHLNDRILSRPGENSTMPQPVAASATSQSAQAPSTAVASADAARSAVSKAIAAAPFDPAGHPLASLGAKPVTEKIHPELPKIPGIKTDAPPPSVPPPLISALPNPPVTTPKA